MLRFWNVGNQEKCFWTKKKKNVKIEFDDVYLFPKWFKSYSWLVFSICIWNKKSLLSKNPQNDMIEILCHKKILIVTSIITELIHKCILLTSKTPFCNIKASISFENCIFEALVCIVFPKAGMEYLCWMDKYGAYPNVIIFNQIRCIDRGIKCDVKI